MIERLGHQGDGIASGVDGGPVYAPGTLPGEVVEGEIAAGHMAAPRIVTPVPERVSPPCRHAKRCGGCQLQHAALDFTAEWKRDVVIRALAAQGIEADVRLTETSPPHSRRRATFSARRTKKGATAGFHQKGSDVIVENPDCLVVRPALSAALPVVEALTAAGASRKSEISVLVTDSDGGLDVAVRGGARPGPVAFAELAQAHDLARLSWDGETLTRRPPTQTFGRAQVAPPPGAFLQATAEGEAALLDAVRHAVGDAARVADLFAGCGTFTLPLAETAEVAAYESDAEMLAALDRGWRHATGLRKVTTQARDLFRNPLLPDELARFDAVVIDPPRAGAEAQINQIARARVPRIAHVSCNPVTFARDTAALIAAGYALGPVRVIDQFRWSTHVELAATLTLER
ncbi:23S rRNA m(5)U-1939 methyltransferase [Citreimonas salinaria]|uniref:23S rRNA m(5)U-1939 methyltransferase n=1 Tax=Citreimonas salinaria TaxID=321339 RepID=A0A1H3FD11_9RHOB|nr:23S rRNA m(5)U-1939 methyltransferase [Citreimonas salinaria]